MTNAEVYAKYVAIKARNERTMTNEQLEELQGDLPIRELAKLACDVDNASCCETSTDFKANLDSAIDNATDILNDLKRLRKEIK